MSKAPAVRLRRSGPEFQNEARSNRVCRLGANSRHEGRVALVSISNRIPSDRKSTRLSSSHTVISYAVFCLKKKKHTSELQSHSDSVCPLLLEKTDSSLISTTSAKKWDTSRNTRDQEYSCYAHYTHAAASCI